MLVVSTFRGLRDTRPVRNEWDADRLHDIVRNPGRGAKDSVGLWSPALYPPGTTRAARNVEAVSALVLDFDGGAPWDTGLDPWRGWCHAAHTSHSHAPALHPYDVGRHCYRVILPLEEPIPVAQFASLWAWAFARSPGADPACKDASRLYYLPVTGDTILRYWYEFVGGPILDWRAIDLPVIELPPKRVAPRIALDNVSPAQRRRAEWGMLERDSEAREAWVVAHGGAVVERPSGRVGHRLTCPGCGRDSLCLVIDYRAKRRAWCEHENSCGYDGYPWRQ